jgi:16S rRNA (adenine1518-N6/adenine1519-N6)-dimethyltransferase
MPQKPKLGQNFLVDAQAAQRIVAALGDLSSRTVVEIGPGRGAITDLLAARAGHVLAVELDRDFAAHLRTRFAPERVAAPALVTVPDQVTIPDRVTIVEQDILQFDFAAAATQAGERLRIAGNLPYYITSPILLKLAASHASLDLAVLMVQREVADRVAAAPGSRDYGLLSVTVQMYGPAELLFTLPPSAFAPPPKVHSAVFRWRFAPRFAELGVDEAGFLRFLRQAFAQKRKTLANNLRAAGVAPAVALAAMDRAAVAPQARAEGVGIELLATLWCELQAR